MIPFLENITRSFDIGHNASHLAFVRFCGPSETKVVFNFTFDQDVDEILAKISLEGFCTGSTSLVK